MSLETSDFYIKITLSISQSLLFTKIRFAHLYNSEGLICSEGSYMLFTVCPLLTYLLQKKKKNIYIYICIYGLHLPPLFQGNGHALVIHGVHSCG